MKNNMKRFLAMFLAVVMIVGLMPMSVFAAENEETEVSGEVVTTQAELSAALASGGTAVLGADIALTSKLTVKADTTITGEYTITRAEGYTGTLFTVNSGKTLTLDGGLVIDGGNNWTFDESFYTDMENFASAGVYKEDYTVSEEGGIVATGNMIGNNGTVILNSVTIQNNWNKHVFGDTKGASLIMNEGALIRNIKGRVVETMQGSWTMNGGKITDIHGCSSNGGLVYISGGTFTINGGEICNVTLLGLNANGNGILAQIYKEDSKLIINGGHVHDNASFVPVSGWGSLVYMNRGGDFEMNGGTLEEAQSNRYTAMVANASTSIVLNGGTIYQAESYGDCQSSCLYGDVTIGENMKIVGGDMIIYGSADNTVRIDGVIEGDVHLNTKATVSGSGKVKGDVFALTDVSIANGTFLGNLVVNSGTLTISGGTFADLEAVKYLAPGLGLLKNDDGTYTVTDQVAEVGGVVYNSVAAAEAAVTAKNNTIKMLAIAPVSESGLVDQDTVIDLNGNEIYATVDDVYPVIRALADVTVKGQGGVDAKTFGTGYAFTVGSSDAAGVLTLAEGDFYGSTTVASVTKGTLNIEGGYYEATPYTDANGVEYGYRYTLNCIDTNYKNGEAVINVTGGTFYGFDPDNNLSEGEGTDFVGEKYESVETTATEAGKESTWTVSRAYRYVAMIEETGELFESLTEAVKAANKLGTATITMLADVTLCEKMTISGNVTIQGEHTLTRADNYTGTFFAVNANATLTLDGGLVIDGGNNYSFNHELYEQDLLNRDTGIAKADREKWFTPEEGAPVATAYMITTSGTVNLNNVTVQNNYSTDYGVVSAGKNSTVNLAGATITHIASIANSGVAVNASGAGINVTMEEGTVIEGNHTGGNHGMFKVYSGTTFTMNGGEIKDNTGWNSNGVAVGVYGATFNMNGGTICGNSSVYGSDNGRNAPVYIHNNGVFNMTGGDICHNVGGSRSGVDAARTVEGYGAKANISGGNVCFNEAMYNVYETPDLNGGEYLVITGGTFTQDPIKWVPEGYGVAIDIVEVDGEEVILYTVTDQVVRLERTGKIYCSIREAMKVAKDGDTLTVLCSHRIDNESVVLDKDVTIDLGGKIVYGWGSVDPIFRIQADVTFTGEGTVNAVKFTKAYAFILGASDGSASGYLTIEGGNYLADVTVASVTKGNLSISGGYFEAIPWKQVVGTDAEGNEITVDNYNFLLNCIDSNYKNGTASISLTGGTYYGFDPENCEAEGVGTNFCADGYISNDNGDNTWTVVADYVCWNMQTGVYYMTVSAGLEEAMPGETVQLLKSTSDVYVLVTPETTLDLNGHVLTAKYVVGFGDADVIDKTRKGLLVVDQRNIVLDEGNAYVPVWNGDNGYRFTQLVITDVGYGMGLVVSEDKDQAKFEFTTFFRDVEGLTDGVTDNDLSIMIRVSWTNATGDVFQDFVYNDEQTGTVVEAQGKQAFTLAISGCNGMQNLTIMPIVKSETGAEFCGGIHNVT